MNSEELKPLSKRLRTLRPRSFKRTEPSADESERTSRKLPHREAKKSDEKSDVKDIFNMVSANESDSQVSQSFYQNFPIGHNELLGGKGSIVRELPKSFERIVADSRNVVHYLSSVTKTVPHPKTKKMFLESLLVRSFSSLSPSCKRSPFGRRVTSMTCHPTKSYLFAAASKGGELALFNLKKNFSVIQFMDGIGAGGSVVALKFHPSNPTAVYTAAITGKVRCQDFCQGEGDVLIDTGTWSNWFCSLDVLPERKLLAAGDCCGITYLIPETGNEVIMKKRMHKRKVTHLEFCPKSPNLLLTCSTDKTVKLWDIRKLDDIPTHTFIHDKGVNSAYFNPSCTSILTTDQNQELRVYSSPWWNMEVSIPHPHRHFQHLTPIKAAWHPYIDAIVVGRYPDKNFLHSDSRTIDFYDGHTGAELYRTACSDVPGITSLNTFNSSGDILISGSGYNVIFWRMKDIDVEVETSQSILKKPGIRFRQAQPKKLAKKLTKSFK